MPLQERWDRRHLSQPTEQVVGRDVQGGKHLIGLHKQGKRLPLVGGRLEAGHKGGSLCKGK